MLNSLMVLAPTKCHWTSQGHGDSSLVQGADQIHLCSP